MPKVDRMLRAWVMVLGNEASSTPGLIELPDLGKVINDVPEEARNMKSFSGMAIPLDICRVEICLKSSDFSRPSAYLFAAEKPG